MFRKYHIVIFKDREGGFKSMRIGGWLAVLLLCVIGGLAAFNLYLWSFYTRSFVLEYELAEARSRVVESDTQLLTLSGKIARLEEALSRVQQFDAKLRVLMNIEQSNTAGAASLEEGQTAPQTAEFGGPLLDRTMLQRHRELFARHTHSLVDELTTQVFVEEVSQQALVHFLRENKEILLSTPSIWPVKGFLTSGFGWRSSPFTGQRRLHEGLDIANSPGTPIRAPARGTVTFAGLDGAYGICITLNHGNNIVTRYAHLQRAHVSAGQSVQRGDVIGALGSTGRSTGPHLHYEVRVGGAPVDPMRYILD